MGKETGGNDTEHPPQSPFEGGLQSFVDQVMTFVDLYERHIKRDDWEWRYLS